MLSIVKKEEENIFVKYDYINKNISLEPKTGVLFSSFIKNTVSKKAKRMSSGYTNSYQSLLNHLENFSIINDVNLYTNSVNEDFLDDFILYLEEQNLRQSYIKNLLTLIKAMVKRAGTYGYIVDQSFDNVEVRDEESFSVYLTLNDIARIYYYNGLTYKQERIKDLFVVGCLTAMRYSDYSTLTDENFSEDYITKITKKTKKKVIVPMHDFVKEIYKKYDGKISCNLSIQHFNRYIKLICKKIGFNDEVVFQYTKGGKLITNTKYRYELIASHTARRSAATNMYLTGRFKTYEIMSITGHSTEKSFFRYIKTSVEHTAQQLKADNYFKK